MEYKDKKKDENNVKKGASLPTTPVDEKDESVLVSSFFNRKDYIESDVPYRHIY